MYLYKASLCDCAGGYDLSADATLHGAPAAAPGRSPRRFFRHHPGHPQPPPAIYRGISVGKCMIFIDFP